MIRLRQLGAWALYGLAVALALAFTSYDPMAGATSSAGANLLGAPGRWVSSYLVEGVGVGAFLLSFALVVAGYRIRRELGFARPSLQAFGVLALMFFFGAWMQAVLPGHLFPGGAAPLGGLLGDATIGRLVTILGQRGTSLLLGLGFFVALGVAGGGYLLEMGQSLLLSIRARRAASRPGSRRRSGAALAAAAGRSATPRSRRRAAPPLPEDLLDGEIDADEEVPAADDEQEWVGREYEDEDPEAELGVDEDGEPDEEQAVEPLRRTEPVRIRHSVSAARSDGIQVINLARDPKLKGKEKYPLPPLSLLADPEPQTERESDQELRERAAQLEEALEDFGVVAVVREIERGPVITRFDLELSRGTKIAKVVTLADDLKMRLSVSNVRISPVKGKAALGVEVPNRLRETVYLREVATSVDLTRRKIALPLFLGKDAAGHPLVEDLAQTPHLLIAGRTGAGKSVFVNNLILSLLLTRYPEEVRLIMIDPKRVELEVYQDIPHLLTRVEGNPKRAVKIFEWAVNQMEERYDLLAAAGVRHVTSFNKLSLTARRERLLERYSAQEVERIPDHLPYIVILVDELADLMQTAGKEVELAIARLTQKARAVGIHVVLATQRPSVDVITGLIKSNLPARLAMQTRTGHDSKTILDRYGAERLLDRGDMLYLSSDGDNPRRIQGPLVSDAEVDAVVRYLKEQGAEHYKPHLEQVTTGSDTGPENPCDQDELFDQAVDIVFATGQASASFLQRRMKVGYSRASRLIDLMADAGIVSEHRGSKAREIIMEPEDWVVLRQRMLQGTPR